MIITTTNINQAYEIKGIVRFYLNTNVMNTQLGKQKSDSISIVEAIDLVVEKILSKQAEDKGADAIIGLQISSHGSAGMASTSDIYVFLGTAVKLK